MDALNLIGMKMGDILDFSILAKLSDRPALFQKGEELFWDDPHISANMLEAHLNPDTDAASRKPETIVKTVLNLADKMGLKKGDRLLDLGCGPGLYCRQLAKLGCRVTGLDYSKRSVEYARQSAKEASLEIEYKYMNYLDIDYDRDFDAILLIYGDFCVFSDSDRDLLLKKIHRALKPGGYFAFDVTTRKLRERYGLKSGWYTAKSGFWKPGSHLVLEKGFDYREENVFLDQYIVIEESGKVSVYRNWFHDYSLSEITAVLEESGFYAGQVWGGLSGEPYSDDSEWIGIIAGIR